MHYSAAQVDFTANTTKGCGPLNVQFSDSSIGAVSWDWDFGNGNQSVLKNPSAIYNISGSYTVKLSITDNAGNVFIKTKTNFIKVYEGPTAYFSASKRKLCPKDTLTFYNQSNKGDADFKSWIWNFGDGNTSEDLHPVHSYAIAGYRNITLLITDKNGCIASKKFTSFIQIWSPPIADFIQDSSLSCKKNTPIGFKSTTSPVGVAHYWSFGTGAVSTVSNPSYTYKQFGKYTVALTVTDANGCKAIKSVNQSVIIDSVIVDFSAVKQSVCDTSSDIKFVNQSNVSISYKWNWDFGDGKSSIAYTPVHKYASFGNFPVSLTIVGPGCIQVKRKNAYIKILRNPPLNITVNDTSACQLPFEIVFRANSTNSATSNWKFGDGNIGTGNTTKHSYYKDDTFSVSVVTTESNGCSVSDTITISKNSLLTIAKGELNGCKPFTLNLKSLIYETTAPVISETWFMGGKMIDTGNLLSYTFPDTGVFKVLYKGLNSKACADTPFYTVKVGDKAKPSYTISKTSACIHDSITAINQTIDPDKKLIYYWDDSEARKGQGKNFTTRFHNTQGKGTIRLIAESNGCRDTFIDKKGVFILSPMVAIKVPKLGCLLPSQIPIVNGTTTWTQFQWKADPAPIKKTNDTMWLLPDSSRAYTVKLFAKNDSTGCEDSFQYNLFLKPNAPKSKIQGSLTKACLPAEVLVKDFGSIGSDIFWKSPLDTGKIYGNNYKVQITEYGIYPILRIAINKNEFQTCTDTSVFFAKIPKPDTRFTVSPNTGCTPLKITLFDSGFVTGRKASWQIGDSIIHAKAFSNSFTIQTPSNNNGTQIQFTAYDSFQRCSEISTQAITVSGPVAEIKHDFLYNCKFTRLQLSYLQTAGKGIQSVVWEIDDTIRSTNSTAIFPVYTLKWVNVKLYVTDSLGCTSKFEKQIYTRVYKPLINIGSDVKGALCPPVAIQFYDSTYSFNNPVETWEWNFGDGTVSNLKNPRHTYLNPGKYTITLKVKNLVGCFATDSFPAFIKVNGPKGVIIKPADSACTPRLTLFETTATGLKDIVWDYGDGTEGNGVKSTHIYKNKGSYKPSAILEDSAGCKTGITASFSLYGLETPIAQVQQLSFCENQALQFMDNSQYYNASPKNLWSLNGNNTAGPKFSYMPVKSKKDTFLFIAKGNLGCNDTLKINPVKSFIIPVFKSLKDTLCLGDTLKLKNLSLSDTAITFIHWKWNNIRSSLNNPSLKAENIGFGNITLVVGNAWGCMDSITKIGETLTGDTISPASDGIKILSVLPDNSLNVALNRHAGFDWRSYNIYEAGNYNYPVVSAHKQDDTILNIKGLDLINRSYCFGVRNSNLCFRETGISKLKFHCQINLQTKPDSGFINISWNAYSGLKPDEYKLYRNKLNEPPVLISTLTGLTFYTIDRDVKCHTLYNYRLEAVFKGSGLISSSDTAQAIPIYKNTLAAPWINFVSVAEENTVKLDVVNSSKTHEMALWQIERSEDGTDFKIWKNITGSESGLLSDLNTNTNKQKYYYRVNSTDVCKGISPYSYAHSSILLLATALNNSIKLKWNPYKNWPAGVDNYKVEVKATTGEFKVLTTTSDTQILLSEIGSRCGEVPEFKVTAISKPHSFFSDSTRAYESQSNVTAPATGYFVLAPNSFTPNNDGLNDVFKPEISWVKTYKMFVYDRWGSKIVEIEGCGSFWDGKIDGQPAPAGVYAYRLEVKANNGSKEYLSGNVLLLK